MQPTSVNCVGSVILLCISIAVNAKVTRETLKPYDRCIWSSLDCPISLWCRSGICQCLDDQVLTGNHCTTYFHFRTYGESCRYNKLDCQGNLICRWQTNKCECRDGFYWNGSECTENVVNWYLVVFIFLGLIAIFIAPILVVRVRLRQIANTRRCLESGANTPNAVVGV